MNSLGPRAALWRSTAVALALLSGGGALAQTIAPPAGPTESQPLQARPLQAKPPEAKPPEVKPTDAAAAGSSAPAQTAAPQAAAPQTATAPETPAVQTPAPEEPPIKTVAQKYDAAIGPQKPEPNLALRDALIREQTGLSQTPQHRAVLRAVDQFYADRGDAPLWRVDGRWSASAKAAFDQTQKAGEDGLDLSSYRVFALGEGGPKALAAADVALSAAVAAYALQASGGRIEPQKISRLIGVHPPIVGAAQALSETSAATDAAATLAAYNPSFPGYQALKQRLAALREAGPPRLASRGGLDDETAAIAARRDPALERELLVNMEFWRWLPRDLGKDRVVVNIPEFTGRLYHDDVETLEFRVITGKPDKATPLFSDKMTYIVVNPSWNVPQSIIRNEFMPKLDALRAQGYEIFTSHGQLHIRQPPGERNALGQVKFVFPNDYAVYMHDTPTRRLFNEERRAFSHGCVRVDQPFRLAEAILGPQHYSEERLRKMVGSTERRINLSASLPVHFVYFTATDDGGGLRRFDDIYGYAQKTAAALGLGPDLGAAGAQQERRERRRMARPKPAQWEADPVADSPGDDGSQPADWPRAQ